jgi:hypothetical protein
MPHTGPGLGRPLEPATGQETTATTAPRRFPEFTGSRSTRGPMWRHPEGKLSVTIVWVAGFGIHTENRRGVLYLPAGITADPAADADQYAAGAGSPETSGYRSGPSSSRTGRCGDAGAHPARDPVHTPGTVHTTVPWNRQVHVPSRKSPSCRGGSKEARAARPTRDGDHAGSRRRETPPGW